MRQGQHKQRSRGRSRKVHNPSNRSYDSNGPDVKIRGTAAHIAEKYTTLSRDAQVAGDRVASENYLQHAEHYNRIVAASQAHLQQQQLQQQQQQQSQQPSSTSQPVANENGPDTSSAGEETVSSAPEQIVGEGEEAASSEEETSKTRSNTSRPRRRRSPSGRNGGGVRSKKAEAESAEAQEPKQETEPSSEAAPELDQTAAE